MLTVLCKLCVTEGAPGYVYRMFCNWRLAMGYVGGFVLCLRDRRGSWFNWPFAL